MSKKRILITGSTDGIGEKTALKLAKKGHKILLHGRNLSKARKVKEKIISETQNNSIEFFIADFESLKELEKMIKKLKNSYSRLDVLINNAGVFEKERVITENGFEKTFQINYLAHFYLTNMIFKLLNESNNAKVINVASVSHKSSLDFDNLQGEKKYSGHDSYARSKLCNILFTYKFDKIIKNRGSKIVTNCLDPGNINTKLLKKGWGPIGTKTESGANKVIFVMNVDDESGNYYVNKRKTAPSNVVLDNKIQNKLWDRSTEMIDKQDIEFRSVM